MTSSYETPGYRIVRELGCGAGGTVFEADSDALERRVALKVFGAADDDEVAFERFQREAHTASRLVHPNIVRVHDSGRFGRRPFYAMELVDGGSLHDVLQNLATLGADPRLGLVAGTVECDRFMVEQTVAVGRALGHAHAEGLVHRDVKPKNLLVALDPPSVKLSDFGLARARTTPALSGPGIVMGTLAYMAPEQLEDGQPRVAWQTDVYGLGATLYELLTGALPFDADGPEQYARAILHSRPRRPSILNRRIGESLEGLILTALERRPADRFDSATTMANSLEAVLAGRPADPGERSGLRHWWRRSVGRLWPGSG